MSVATSTPMTELELFSAFLQVTGYAENTILAYLQDLGQVQAFLEERGLTWLTADHRDLAEYLKSRTDLDPRSRNRQLFCLRRFYRTLVNGGMRQTNPARVLSSSRHWRFQPVWLSVEEMARLIEAPDPGRPLGLRDRALMELAYSSALRVGELVSLSVSSLDLDLRFVRLLGKGRRERVVPVGRPAVAAIRDYLRVRSSFKSHETPALFLSFWGGRLGRQDIYRLVQGYAERAGVRREGRSISPNTFSHSCATHLLDAGCDLRYIQELLGHASIRSTQIYTHVALAQLQRVYQRAHPHA